MSLTPREWHALLDAAEAGELSYPMTQWRENGKP
jgi:hypothetical protein